MPFGVVFPTHVGVNRYIQRLRWRPGRIPHACGGEPAQADLAEAYRDIDTTPSGDGKSERVRERIEARIDEHRRALRWAIADIRGQRRTTVELI